jgi:hypothetical protein
MLFGLSRWGFHHHHAAPVAGIDAGAIAHAARDVLAGHRLPTG